MYAVIETGGKQYRVDEGESVRVERLAADAGAVIEFDKVLMIGGGDAGPRFGTPYLDKSKVTGTVKAQGRHRKVEIVKFKRRQGYRRHQGHRQNYTEIAISGIELEQSSEQQAAT